MDDRADLIPRPDPTMLTTAQLLRELSNLESRITARLDAMDKATVLSHDDFTRIPTMLDREIGHVREFGAAGVLRLNEMVDERLARVDTLFTELNKRTEALGLANATALAAALAAQEKAYTEQNRSRDLAISKSDANTQQQIQQLQTQFQTELHAASETISEIKSRLDRGEGGTAGNKEARTERRLDTGLAVAISVGCVSLAGIIITILNLGIHH